MLMNDTPKILLYQMDVPLINIPQCEASKIAKLVYNSNKYGLWYL